MDPSTRLVVVRRWCGVSSSIQPACAVGNNIGADIMMAAASILTNDERVFAPPTLTGC